MPIWLRLTAVIWLMLAIAWSGMIAWEAQVNRDTAIEQAEGFAQSIHEMTLAGLTGMMITGTIGQREVFLDQIKQLPAVKKLEVIRGEAVDQQFGKSAKESHVLDADEIAAFASRQQIVRVETDPALGQVLRVVKPALASEDYLGKNCMGCHLVPNGTPLGLVSMKVSLDDVNAAAKAFLWKSILIAFGLSLPLIGSVIYFIRRFVMRPMAEAVSIAEEVAAGNLSRDIEVTSQDETGQLLTAMKKMVETFRGFAAAQAEMAKQHDAGMIDEQIAAQSFPGVYGKMAQSINELV
ncbi:MAG: HAMP domain-containing protein, partial [Rhodocyclaceae bacterium]